MRARALAPLAFVAALMVVWLSVRMWCGTMSHVWMASCFIGAWSPLAAAALFLYIREIGRRDDSVALAWLVRALGMHFVLSWMLGFSDWLRGPPSEPPAWNMDLGAPVALFSFAPIFAVSVFSLGWLASVSRRLREPVMRPAIPGENIDRPSAFRGVRLISVGPALTRVPFVACIVALVGILASIVSASVPYWLLPTTAITLATLTARNRRAFVPSVFALVAITLTVLLRRKIPTIESQVSLGITWPWLSLLTIALFLCTIEATVRVRNIATRRFA